MRYEAKAIGSGSEAAQSELQDKWHSVIDDLINTHGPGLTFLLQQLSLKDAQLLALRVLKQVMEEKLDHHNVQIAQVRHPFILHYASRTEDTSPGHAGKRVRDSGSSTTERSHRANVICTPTWPPCNTI